MDAVHKQKSLQFKKTMDVSLALLPFFFFLGIVTFSEILCCVATYS